MTQDDGDLRPYAIAFVSKDDNCMLHRSLHTPSVRSRVLNLMQETTHTLPLHVLNHMVETSEMFASAFAVERSWATDMLAFTFHTRANTRPI